MVRLDAKEDRLCELINGTLVEKTAGYEESAIMIELGGIIRAFVKKRRLGIVTGADGMMRLFEAQVRIPDVAFVSKARLPGGTVPEHPVPELVPDLAVEILSESNTRREMSDKLGEYFRAGVRLVWYVNPKTRTIDVFTGVEQKTTLTVTDTLSGGDVLPGLEVPVADVFNIQ
ncbi:MAG TPA: Uma2 family endonuclease [Tepidisphaeraceae bacterium]